MNEASVIRLELEDINSSSVLEIDRSDATVLLQGEPIVPPLSLTERQILGYIATQPNILHRTGNFRSEIFAEGETPKQRRDAFERAVGTLAIHQSLNGYVTRAKGKNDRFVGITTRRFSREPFHDVINERVEPHRNKLRSAIVDQSYWPILPAKILTVQTEQEMETVRQTQKISPVLFAAAKRAHLRMREVAGLHSIEFLQTLSADDTVLVEHILSSPRHIFTARDMMEVYRATAGEPALSDEEVYAKVIGMLSRLHKAKRHEGGLLYAVAQKIQHNMTVRYDKDPSKYPDATRLPLRPEDITMWRVVTNHAPLEEE
jgi:hypothetical protein